MKRYEYLAKLVSMREDVAQMRVITKEESRRVDEGQKKINKWLEEHVNERARECGVKEGGCIYL